MGLMKGWRLAALGGGGWLGRALILAALQRGVIAPADICITSRRGRLEGFEAFPAVTVSADNQAAPLVSEAVLLAVRPQDLDQLSLDLSGKLVLSVMAMVPMEEIRRRFGSVRIIRAMPNAAAEQCLSFTPLLASPETTPEDRSLAAAFFGASGLAEWVATESELDYLTGLTGSGPAFFAALAAAMERDAVAQGLPPALASRAIGQLIKGAAPMLAGERSPADLVDIFLDYQGTTAAGLKALEENGLSTLVRVMLEAAREKAAGLS